MEGSFSKRHGFAATSVPSTIREDAPEFLRASLLRIATEENFAPDELRSTDDIIRMRYVEINGQLRKVMVIIKMRGSNHTKDIREYVLTDTGLKIISPRETDYARLTTGAPDRISQPEEPAPEPKTKR